MKKLWGTRGLLVEGHAASKGWAKTWTCLPDAKGLPFARITPASLEYGGNALVKQLKWKSKHFSFHWILAYHRGYTYLSSLGNCANLLYLSWWGSARLPASLFLDIHSIQIRLAQFRMKTSDLLSTYPVQVIAVDRGAAELCKEFLGLKGSRDLLHVTRCYKSHRSRWRIWGETWKTSPSIC